MTATDGGLILQFETASSSSVLVKLSPLTGKETWHYTSPGWLSRSATIHPEGTYYVVEMQQSPKPESALIGIDPVSGVVKSRLPFPLSQTGEKNFGCKQGNDHLVQYPSSVGIPMTSEHNSVFLEVEVYSSIHDALPCKNGGTLSISSSLRLIELKEDGSQIWRTIKQFTYGGSPYLPEAKSLPQAIAGEVIPEGLGGVQAAWTYSGEGSQGRIIEARITRVSATEMKEFSLPFPGWGGTPWDTDVGHMVLGEASTGTGMASVGNQVVAYDVATGAVKWTWHSGQGRVQILMSLQGDNLMVVNRGEVVQLDATGKLSPQSQEALARRYDAPVVPEDGGNDEIDADGMTVFEYEVGQFLAIQTPRPPDRPSSLVGAAMGHRIY
jgi:putative pyrroloquinoline-quinone binding quinoprotein